MKREELLRPLSGAEPCGPDLNAAMDPDYDAYYFGALGRLPSFYFQPGVERPDGSRTQDLLFDPSELRIGAETARIDALLARSRDIRLLVLQAQWEALAGRIGPLSEAVEAVAALLETYPDMVHPGLAAGHGDRREAINDLNQPVTMVQALQFAGLTGNAEVTLRKLRVARGEVKPLENETGLAAGALMDALGQASYRPKVTETHGAILRFLDALKRIEAACQGNRVAPFSPGLEDIRKVAADILAAIQTARPDLRGADLPRGAPDAPPAAPAPDAQHRPDDAARDGSGEGQGDGQGDGQGTPAGTPAAPPAAIILSHLHARRVLEACETYYRMAEPSSAALLLVTQARLLIGRPLVEALETLLPQQAPQAIVDFGPQTGFRINLDRMRILTGAMPEGGSPMPPTDPGPTPVITDAGQAATAIRAVEEYFRRTERSSPVPLLLQRARSYLDRDFQSLIDELIPRPPGG